MSDSEKQSLSLKEKDGVEKRGRGRPRKHPKSQESSGSPASKRPRGRPKGSKNKGPAKKRAVSSSGKKVKGKPTKKEEKADQAAQESSEEDEEDEDEEQ